jgi:UDP:flavonoid glycosyltransferase YjiC (YdhE family)
VRFLFTFPGGTGHFEALAPVARAVAGAGHDVAFTTRPLMVPIVAAAGFAALPTFADDVAMRTRRPLLEVSMERERRDLRERFAARAGVRADGILALGRRPDAIVRDESDFGAAIAAELLGVPWASVLILATDELIRAQDVAEPLDAVRARYGLAPDPELARLPGDLVLNPFPPSLRAAGHALRFAPTGRGDPEGPVYFTLGTEFNLESGDLYERVLAGLRGYEAIVTVGRELDPAELSPAPGIRVERFIPHAEVLPRCRAVISHGGSGTVLTALAHGLPMVLIPMGADQPLTAARAEALGAARVLDAVRATPEDVREALADVLADPRYRAAAERLRAELEALPGVERAVELLSAIAPSRAGSSPRSGARATPARCD